MDLTFIKDADDRWYIDLPNWKGSKADLEMVCGADTFLDEISNRGHVVKLKVSLNSFHGSKFHFKKIREQLVNGADYLEVFTGHEM